MLRMHVHLSASFCPLCAGSEGVSCHTWLKCTFKSSEICSVCSNLIAPNYMCTLGALLLRDSPGGRSCVLPLCSPSRMCAVQHSWRKASDWLLESVTSLKSFLTYEILCHLPERTICQALLWKSRRTQCWAALPKWCCLDTAVSSSVLLGVSTCSILEADDDLALLSPLSFCAPVGVLFISAAIDG